MIAAKLPSVSDAIATPAMSISQSRRTGQNTVSSNRSNSAKLAVFDATLMYAVIGVGAPSYTSGAHWWNGTAATLKKSPATTVTSARSTKRSQGPRDSTATAITSRLVRGGSGAPMALRLAVAPMPYRIEKP